MWGQGHRRRWGAAVDRRGFSLPELLAVLAIAGLALAVAIPLIAEQVRQAKVRTAADQLSTSLKAARMIAVSKRKVIDVAVAVAPSNSYSYEGTDGKTRTIAMPDGVRIVSSTTPIRFKLDGSLPAQATTVLEADLTGGAKERWTITTSVLGVSKVTRARVGG